MKYILSFMALWLVACQSANPYEDKTCFSASENFLVAQN